MDAVYFQYHIVPPQLRKDDEALIRAENISSNSEFKNLRQEWSAELVKMFQPDPESKLQVRPWEILLKSDGSVENRAIARDVDDDLEKGYDNARFRIPSNTIQELGREEKVRRTERFALGSLLYEILSNKNIFPDLSDDTIQDRFNRGDFPEEVYSLPMGPYILGCWSREFEQELERQLSLQNRFSNYVKKHPYLFAGQVAGGILSTAALITIPILGLVGFSAIGPVAGSAAAAWQASMGIVEAGSIFAWCQGAAMGGAAVGGLVGCGVAGGSVALAATGGALVLGGDVLTPALLREMFQQHYRKGGSEGPLKSLS